MGALIIYMFICSFTPGPGNILALKTTTTYGWKNSLKLLLGICLGYALVQTICSVCLYQLNTISGGILKGISIMGACYMVWLAWHIIKSKPDMSMEEKKPTFYEGLLLQLVNVKIYFYIMSLLSKYFIPASDTIMELVLCGAFAVSIGCVACFVWASAGVLIQKYYVRHFKCINMILGILLLYCAVKMIH